MTAFPDPATRAAAERVLRLSRWLDQGLRLPGTQWRIGPEALLGLVPVVGDAVGLLLSLWLIFEARRAGAPQGLLLRMVGNALLDAGVGAVPVVGDLFDFLFRANARNAELLRAHLEPAASPPSSSRLRRTPLFIGLCLIAALAWWWSLRAG